MKIYQYIKKLQGLSDDKKKIVFFSIMALAILVVGLFGVISTKNGILKIRESAKSINIPKIDFNASDFGGDRPALNFNGIKPEDLGIVPGDTGIENVSPGESGNLFK